MENIHKIPKDNSLNCGEYTQVKINTTYQRGGHNWGTGDLEEGGFYVHISFGAFADGSSQTTLYGNDSFKALFLPAKRNSKKKIEKIDDYLDREKILAKFKDGKQAVANEIFRQAKDFK